MTIAYRKTLVNQNIRIHQMLQIKYLVKSLGLAIKKGREETLRKSPEIERLKTKFRYFNCTLRRIKIGLKRSKDHSLRRQD